MNRGQIRQILEELYLPYRDDGRVVRMPAHEIFRLLGIKDGTDLAALRRTPFIEKDAQENLHLTDEGVFYMERVYDKYIERAGRISNGHMENPAKKQYAFDKVDEEIKGERSGGPQTVHIRDSQFHFGDGQNISARGVVKQDVGSRIHEKWWQRPEVIIGVVTVIIALISIPYWPVWYRYFFPTAESIPSILTDSVSSSQSISTTTTSLVSILDKNFTFRTEAERQDFREEYLNEEVYGEGIFVDRSKDQNYNMQFLYMNDGRYPVVCKIENPSEGMLHKLALLTPGNKVLFTGFFTGTGMAFALVEGSWVLNNCTLYF